MKVKVNLYSTLKKYAPTESGGFEPDLDQAATIRDLTDLLGLPNQVQRVVLVNGRLAQPDKVLSEGDEVVIFPPVEGG